MPRQQALLAISTVQTDNGLVSYLALAMVRVLVAAPAEPAHATVVVMRAPKGHEKWSPPSRLQAAPRRRHGMARPYDGSRRAGPAESKSSAATSLVTDFAEDRADCITTAVVSVTVDASAGPAHTTVVVKQAPEGHEDEFVESICLPAVSAAAFDLATPDPVTVIAGRGRRSPGSRSTASPVTSFGHALAGHITRGPCHHGTRTPNQNDAAAADPLTAPTTKENTTASGQHSLGGSACDRACSGATPAQPTQLP